MWPGNCSARRSISDAGNVEGLDIEAIHVLGERETLVVETDPLAVELPNEAGALARVARKLAQANVNIEYTYQRPSGQPGIRTV